MSVEKVCRHTVAVLSSKALEVFDGHIDVSLLRQVLLAVLAEHEKGIQVNMSWDQQEAYDQWYDAHSSAERLLRKYHDR